MNKYISKLFGVMFQSQQTQQAVRIQPQHAPTSPEEWRQHWQSQGQSWRTEPEIDAKRQEELSKRRAIIPDIEKGIYPFKDMKLSRADAEWLLATHTHRNGRGPVDWKAIDWSGGNQIEEPEGLDLRGANLQEAKLQGLPLASLYGGIPKDFYLSRKPNYTSDTLREMAAMHMPGADLRNAHLEGACLYWANLEGADMNSASLENADLSGASLKKCKLDGASLYFASALGAHFERARLSNASLEHANFSSADFQNADLHHARLKNASFYKAKLQRATLIGAQLEDSDFRSALLEGANLQNATLDRADFSGAHLEGAVIDGKMLGEKQRMGPKLVDVSWDKANLADMTWSKKSMLGDEYEARQKMDDGKIKSNSQRRKEFELAARANRQLAIAFESQGLSEGAAFFAHRACSLQRKVYWRQRNFWKWFGSVMLALLAGYGYRMWRIIVAYLFIVLLCAGAYFVLGLYYEPHLSVLDAMLTSITAFHGRVFSEPFLRPGEPQLWVTAFEAVAGLIIEGVFIAMLTQKFFGK